jgi:hypothetical protein
MGQEYIEKSVFCLHTIHPQGALVVGASSLWPLYKELYEVHQECLLKKNINQKY